MVDGQADDGVDVVAAGEDVLGALDRLQPAVDADGSTEPRPHTRTLTGRRSRLAKGGAPHATSTDSSESTWPDDQTSPSSRAISSS